MTILPTELSNVNNPSAPDPRGVRERASTGRHMLTGEDQEGSYPDPDSNYHLPQVWAQFLSQFNWNWYGHFTFRDYPHPETACRAWDRWIHRLNREIYGVHYWKDKSKGVFWARGTEDQKRGAIHFHALIGGIPDYVHRMRYLDDWFLSSGIARIFKYEANKGAEFYMSKSSYAWKKGEIDTNDSLRMELEGKRSCGRVRESEDVSQPDIHRPVSSYRW